MKQTISNKNLHYLIASLIMIMRNSIECFDNQKESIVNISMLKINSIDSINSFIFKIITPISTIKQHIESDYYVNNILSYRLIT